MTAADAIISRTERAYILTYGVFISLLNLTNMVIVSLDKVYNPPPFGIYDMARASAFPVGRFLSIFIFLFLMFSKRFYFALGWTLLCLFPFLYEFTLAYVVLRNMVDFLNNNSALWVFLMIANPFDYLSTALKIVLFVWLVSIIIRSQTSKNE